MLKEEFLAQLRGGLAGLPQEDLEERLAFYSELLDDRMEEELSEAEAVAAAGPVEQIVQQIIAETPLTKIVKEKMRPKRRLQVWEIVLLALGSPVWLSLGLAALAVVLSLYVVVWSLDVSLWAVFAALGAGAAGGVLGLALGSGAARLAMLAAGMVLAGLAILLFFGCKAATMGIWKLTKAVVLRMKHRFLGKEDAQ